MVEEPRRKSPSLLFIAAMEFEIRPFLSSLGLRRVKTENLSFYHGYIGTQSVLVLVSGIGQKHARETALWAAEQKPELVVNLGFAGAVSPLYSVGDIFVPFEIRNLKGERISCHALHLEKQHVVKGVLLTVDSIAQTKEKKKSLSTLADAVDMESFAIASVMQEHKIPFRVVRIISDAQHESFPIDFNVTLKDGEIYPWKVLRPLFKKPHVLPSMVKLGLRSSRLARQLCDFALPYAYAVKRHA